jgi:hypothetical protein
MFKCLCDTIILDDFKTALDKLSTGWLARNGMHTIGQHTVDFRSHPTFKDERAPPNADDNISFKYSVSAVHIE